MLTEKVEKTDIIQVTTDTGKTKFITVNGLKEFMGIKDSFFNHIEMLGNRINSLENPDPEPTPLPDPKPKPKSKITTKKETE